MKISLLLDPTLTINESNQLTVNISSEQGNTLQMLEDGLYAEARPNGSGDGHGYQNGRSSNGMTVGTLSPFSSEATGHRVNAPCIIHRIFTCTQTDGSDIDLRSGSDTGDYVLPGDFFRVLNGSNYDYYLILNTAGGGTGRGGSYVTESTKVASVPVSAKLNPND